MLYLVFRSIGGSLGLSVMDRSREPQGVWAQAMVELLVTEMKGDLLAKLVKAEVGRLFASS